MTDWWNFLESTAQLITLSTFWRCNRNGGTLHSVHVSRAQNRNVPGTPTASVLLRSWNLRLLMLSLFGSKNCGKTYQIQQPRLFPARNSVNANVAAHAATGQKFSVHVSSFEIVSLHKSW